MFGRSPVLYLTLLSTAGSALVVAKLLWTGLHRRYRVFFLYFLFRIINFSIVLPMDTGSSAYFWIWLLVSEPFSLLLYVLNVRELVGLILEKHEGIRTLVRWFMYASIVVSAAVSTLTMVSKLTPKMSANSVRIFYVSAIDRGITFALAIFLIFLLFFLSRYPVALGRNIITHASLFTLFFLSSTLTSLVRSVFRYQLYPAFDTSLLGFATLCVFSWFFLLSPKGEEIKVSISHFSPEQEERILYKLDALNATILKVGGK